MANAKNVKRSAVKSATAKAKSGKTSKPVNKVQGNTQVCKTNLAHKKNVTLPLTAENFSPIDGGAKGFRKMCKKCQVVKSKEWTDSRPDLRKAQANARKYTKLGIPTQMPLAKEWIDGKSVLMTIEHSVMPNGKIELGNVKGAKSYFPSVPADAEFEKYKQAKIAKREAEQAQKDADAKLAKDQRDAERAEKRKQKEDKAKADKEAREATRAENKKKRDAEAAEKARLAKEKRDADAIERTNKRNAEATEKANKAKQDRDAKNAEKAKAALDAKNQQDADAKAKRDADSQKTLNALTKGKKGSKGKGATATVGV